MTYGSYTDLARSKTFDKVLYDKWLVITNNPKYDWCQRALASILY